jgi:hypothetical protein
MRVRAFRPSAVLVACLSLILAGGALSLARSKSPDAAGAPAGKGPMQLFAKTDAAPLEKPSLDSAVPGAVETATFALG